MSKSISRQRTRQMRVPVLVDEAEQIKANAASCGLSVAAYLRALGLDYQPKSILDANAVTELVKINADLGRLGGLLKMFLTNNDRLKSIGKEQATSNLQQLLADISKTQTLLFEKAQQL